MNWNAILKWGLILGLTCAVLQLLWGFTGWYAHPILSGLFVPIVFLINIVLIVLALRSTRAASGYGGQLLQGLLIGLVGGAIIFVGGLILTHVIAPDFATEIAEMQEVALTQAGWEEARVQQIVEATRNTPGWLPALQGFLGTLFTSLVTAGIAAIWLRRKGESLAPSTAPQ